jgi:hypothetical protein
MEIQTVKGAFLIANSMCKEIENLALPPSEGKSAATQKVVIFSLVKSTRGYIEKVTHQVNTSYEHGSYDACAVMIRRLVETLIIELFEAFKIESKIKNSSGDFLYLKDLVDKTLAETSWNLSRNSKKSLPRLKDIGDKSAHSRRFNALREDIDNMKDDLRVVIQELVSLAKLK